MHLFRCILLLVSLSAAATTSIVHAQSPFVGTYSGHLTVELTGAYNTAPTVSGKMIFNVFADGTVAEIGGDPVGVVGGSGEVVWELPNSYDFESGHISDGTLIAESSTAENNLTRTLRIEAKILGGAFPQGQTFTDRLVDLSPTNGYRDHHQVISTGSGFIAVGKTGTIALSDNGLDWRRSAAPTAKDLHTVAFGNNTYLIGGDNAVLMTSADGVNWVPRNSPFLFSGFAGIVGITGATYGDDVFVITSQFGEYATSQDGITWTVGGEALASSSLEIAFFNEQFVAWSGSNIRFSADLENWSSPVNAGVSTISDVSFGQGRWIVGGDSGIAVSTDGENWTQVRSDYVVRAVEAGHERFVASIAGSDGNLLYSLDSEGTTWREANGPRGGTSIAFDGIHFVMAGRSLKASSDGISWWAINGDPRGENAPSQRVMTNSDGTRTVMTVNGSGPHQNTIAELLVGPNGTLYLNDPYLKTTLDSQTTHDLHAVAGYFVGGEAGVIRKVDVLGGTTNRYANVTLVDSPTSVTLRNGVSYGADTIMVGNAGTIVRFSASTASLEPSGTNEDLRFVDVVTTNSNATLPPLLIAVGDNGTMLVRSTSDTDGDWVSRDTGTTANLVGVAYLTANFRDNIHGRYVAVGTDGSIISSVDSVTWMEENHMVAPGPLISFSRTQGMYAYTGSVSGQSFHATLLATADGIVAQGGATVAEGSIERSRIAYGKDRLVKVAGDRVYVSRDGINWDTTRVPGTFRDVAYGNGVFVAVGGDSFEWTETDRVYFSYDGLDWRASNQPAFNRQFTAVVHIDGRFIATGRRGFIAGSADGITWEEVQTDTTESARDIADIATNGENIVVAVGSDSSGSRAFVISSIDGGQTWTVRQDTNNGGYSSVVYGNGLFVLVGENRIRRSTDGINFTAGLNISHQDSSTGSDPDFTHIFFANDVFVATTAEGQAYVSSDSVIWEERFTGVRGGFTDSEVANGQVWLASDDKLLILAIEDKGSPYVVQQPQDSTVAEGATVQLSATAIGVGPLTYQWTRDGIPLVDGASEQAGFTSAVSGANTLELRIENATPADSGTYRLIVTNALGGRSSQAAEVFVASAPTILDHPKSLIVAPGAEASFTVDVTDPNVSYQWFFNEVPIPEATAPTHEIENVLVENAGLYAVEVSNAAGAIRSAPASLSVSAPRGGNLDLQLDAVFHGNVPELRPTNVTLQFGTFPSFILRQVLVQPDGKILIAGQFEYTGGGGEVRHSLIRLNHDGTLDTGFAIPALEVAGYNGSSYAASIEQVALAADGALVLVGNIQRVDGVNISATKAVLLRADGTHVSTFSPNISGSATASSVAVDSKGRVVIGGKQISGSSSRPRHIYRYQPDGKVDAAFSGADLGHGQLMGQSVATLADDRVIYAAYTTDFSAVRSFRLTTTGEMDSTFASADFGARPVDAITILPNGDYIANGGFETVNGAPYPGIARFGADGLVAESFSPQGSFASGAQVNATVPLTGEFLLAAGSFTTTGETPATHLAVLTPEGTLVESGAIGTGFDFSPTAAASNMEGTEVFIIGNFSKLNGQPVGSVLRLTAQSSHGGPTPPLAIVSHSSNQTFTDGSRVTLTIAATGGNLTFQWFHNDDVVEGATSASLALGEMSEVDAGSYRVEVSDASGSISSEPIVLTYEGESGVVPFSTWITTFDLPADLRAPLDDPSGNGRPNILEFLLGNDPTSGALPPIFTTEFVEDGSVKFLFRTAKAAGHVPFVVEATQNLHEFDGKLVPTVSSRGEDEESHYWEAKVVPTDPNQGVFVRLRVDLIEN